MLELRSTGPTVDDDEIAGLRATKRLELRVPELFDTAITDASVPELGALSALRTLRLTPGMSDVAVDSLRALRPDLDVEIVEIDPGGTVDGAPRPT